MMQEWSEKKQERLTVAPRAFPSFSLPDKNPSLTLVNEDNKILENIFIYLIVIGLVYVAQINWKGLTQACQVYKKKKKS